MRLGISTRQRQMMREVVARKLRRLCQLKLLERAAAGRYRIPNRAALVASVRE